MITEDQISDIIRKSFGHRVLDPAPGVMDDLRTLVIAAASFGHLESVDQLAEQASFIRSLETTLEKYEQNNSIDAAGQHNLAAAEARERGMAFIVDGKHVNADRVFILSLPDTTGPISDMRRAKADAERTMRELEAFKIGRAEAMPNVRNEMTGQYLRSLMNAAGMPTPPEHHDDEYLGTHSYITMCDIETAVVKLVNQRDNALDLMNQRAASMSRINEMLGAGDGPSTSVKDSCEFTESVVAMFVQRLTTLGRVVVDPTARAKLPSIQEVHEVLTGKHQCTSPRGGFACQGCTCGAPRKGMEQAAPVIPTVISSQGCGICGVAFTGQGWVCLNCSGAKS